MPASSRSRTVTLRAIIAVLVLLAGALSLPELVHDASAGAAPTVYVSLTWDDGRASQIDSLAIQQAHNMPATYYLNSPMIGSKAYYMTRPQIDQLAAAGNEIGGHTDNHLDLTKLSTTDARAEICNDRDRLISWYGTAAGRSFAYPFGANNPTVRALAKDCGYVSARTTTGVTSPTSCLSCRPSESLPPADPYGLAAAESVNSTTTLADLKFQVTQASANGGGWVIYTMHSMGTEANSLSVDPALYSQFLDWLGSRSDVQVRTVGDLMGQGLVSGTTAATSPQRPPVLTPVAMSNADLELDADRNGVSDCWLRGSSGTNTAAWTRTSDAHSGTAAEQVTISSITTGDRKIVPKLDTGTAAGGCAPSVNDTHAYRISSWYRSTSAVNFVVYVRDAAGTWKYWRTGPSTPAASSYSLATWDTPLVPAGTNAISFGLALSTLGTLTTDDYAVASIAPATTALVDSIVLNSSLELDGNGDGVPDCWSRTGYGINNATFSRVADAHTGFWGEKLVVSSLTSGDRKLVPTLDNGQASGGCAPSATGGSSFQLGAWYRSDVPAQLIAFYRDTAGAWRWWLSTDIPSSPIDWRQALFTTPPLPTGATAITFGIGLTTTGTLITDDYSVVRAS